jgi:hypothetical protein
MTIAWRQPDRPASEAARIAPVSPKPRSSQLCDSTANTVAEVESLCVGCQHW